MGFSETVCLAHPENHTTVYQNFKTVSKACGFFFFFYESKETIVPDEEYICLSLRNACFIFSSTENVTSGHIFVPVWSKIVFNK